MFEIFSQYYINSLFHKQPKLQSNRNQLGDIYGSHNFICDNFLTISFPRRRSITCTHYPYQPSPEKWQSNRAWRGHRGGKRCLMYNLRSTECPPHFVDCLSLLLHAHSFLHVFPRTFSRPATTISRWDFIHSRTCAIPVRKYYLLELVERSTISI